MKVGFTGTRSGMTTAQKRTFAESILESESWEEFHHGACVGADDDADLIVNLLTEALVITHPGSDQAGRMPYYADPRSGVTLAAKPYLERNKDIVNATDWMIATPGERGEQDILGTWATIRYAEKQCKPVFVIWPDGASEWR